MGSEGRYAAGDSAASPISGAKQTLSESFVQPVLW